MFSRWLTVVFALSLTTNVWAGQAGSRPNTTGSSSGTATPRVESSSADQARPRNDRATTEHRVTTNNRSVYYPNNYQPRYRYYYPYSGYGYGLGYVVYDPFMFSGRDYRDVGRIRLKIKPNYAQVYVDGYYVGMVDSFDGMFQSLGLKSGAHVIELRAEGYDTPVIRVLITRGETITYKGELTPWYRRAR